MTMTDPLADLPAALARLSTVAGGRLLVTAGPTCEDLDEVRFLTNRSTGRMGLAVAAAGAAAGWRVLLLLGPTPLPPPPGVECVRFRSAADLHRAVLAAWPWCEALVMTAAVADYTPAEKFAGKLKKGDGELVLRFKRTVDILRDLAERPDRPGKTVIGFALETEIDLAEGERKLRAKKLDAIVVNATRAFGAEDNSAWLLSPGAAPQDLGCLPKTELARRLVAQLRRPVPEK